MDTQQLQIILEALGAALLGGVIGFEREMSKKPAGLRTYILIATSACLLVNLGTVFIETYKDFDVVKIDPVRTIEAIVAAIGFIGGGMLIKSKDGDNVKNLTTAALTLFTATIGISVALDQYILAVFLALFSVLVSTSLYKLEKKLPDKLSKK